jgi:hypothetical protein
MSGQSAALTLKEACAMQERVQAAGSQAACGSGGRKSSGAPKEMHKKEK